MALLSIEHCLIKRMFFRMQECSPQLKEKSTCRSLKRFLPRHKKLYCTDKAYTMIELLITMFIIGILAAIAIGAFQYYKYKAYNITVKHDLKSFATAQQDYFNTHNAYHGSSGDYIEGGHPPSGPLVSSEFNFLPSEGVIIRLTGQGATFTAQASHRSATKKYNYNFTTGQITEEDA